MTSSSPSDDGALADLSTDGAPWVTPFVETSVEFDESVDALRDALLDPELLSAWLGEWTVGDDGTTVVTDDGVRRRVTDHRRTDHGVSWRWSDEEGTTSSSVTITLEPAGELTRLTVREVVAGPSMALGASGRADRGDGPTVRVVLDGAAWLASLLALGAVLAASSLVRV